MTADKYLSFFSNLTLRMSVEDFMKRLLEIALETFPEFDRGSVMMEKGGVWRYVAWVGFPDSISEIEIDENGMFIPDSDDPLVIEDILAANKTMLKPKTIDELRKIGSGDIRKTVSVALKDDSGKIIGAMFLDSTKDVEVDSEALEAIKAFSKIASLFTAMKLYQERERNYQKSIVLAMMRAMEVRDPYTVGHSSRVAKYSAELAKKIGLDMEVVDAVYWGALIHDLGKLAVPEHILLKPGRLDPKEFEVMKRHTIVGEAMIRDYPWLERIRPILRHHHERFDGKGYPDGLKGDEIPLDVRIVSIADAFDAMTSDRAYRKALKLDEASNEMWKERGKQFDPELVPVFLDVVYNMYGEA